MNENSIMGEKKISILMADLTGFTAMTEIHGSFSAATIIEKYLELAEKAMCGKSRLLERAGDQLVIISECPDDITCTALKLLEHTSAENNFLPIHAGLHYGTALEQAGSFYGTSMNLTSRIAAKAKRNSILCSQDFVNAVTKTSEFYFKEVGKVKLKYIKSPVLISELIPCNEIIHHHIHTDLICHMSVKENKSFHYLYKNQAYHFCSEQCMYVFQADPEQALLSNN